MIDMRYEIFDDVGQAINVIIADQSFVEAHHLGRYREQPEDFAIVKARVAAEIRTQRNVLLSQTDWSQGKDIPDAISSKYTAYRQALRDLPAQAGFPDNIVWPTKPE